MTDAPPAAPPARRRAHLAVAAAYAAAAAVVLWPVASHPTTRILSAGGDGSQFLWAWWWMPRAMAHGHDPFVTHQQFHPVGANLAFHTTAPLVMVVTWPVGRLFGVGAAVNVSQVAALLLSALGAYFLALRLTGDRAAAFFAGFAFAFVPYRFVQMGGHFNLVHVEVLPFGILAFLRFLDVPTRRRACLLGLLVGLTFLIDFYLLSFLLLSLAVLAVSWRRRLDRVALLRLLEGAGVAVAVSLPLLVPMISALLNGELDHLKGWGDADRFSADVLGWFLPSPTHPLWGSTVGRKVTYLSAGGEGLANPGLVVLALAYLGRGRVAAARRRGWVALAAVAALLSFGPFLQVGGHTGGLFSYLGRRFAVPLPYMAWHFLPVLNGVRVPGRFAIVAALALDVLAATTLASLAGRRRVVAIAAALAVTAVEFLPGPVLNQPTAVPEAYHRIAADPGRGAVLEVPLQWQSGFTAVGDVPADRDDSIFYYYATVHGRPMVSGYVSHYPDKRLRRLVAVPLYRQVLALGGEPGFEDAPTFGVDDLRRQGIGYVVYHRDRPWPQAYDYLSRLGLPVLADDGTTIAWKVPE
ncbi:MAG TPA: hypothetical protein VFJ85_18010 [Acidimicrobiales bacterium]|nr:hypothetical protein [Acidimicrobiales bacterium]